MFKIDGPLDAENVFSQFLPQLMAMTGGSVIANQIKAFRDMVEALAIMDDGEILSPQAFSLAENAALTLLNEIYAGLEMAEPTPEAQS
jgi:hypothetical protein